VEQSENLNVSESIAKAATALDARQANGDGGGKGAQQDQPQQNEQLRKAVEEINKKAHNSEAIFGIHEATNRVTIKIIDKETKEVIKELPPEKTLDMIAKVWEMAGILVDEKR
jgi:flagellar protein FlaG